MFHVSILGSRGYRRQGERDWVRPDGVRVRVYLRQTGWGVADVKQLLKNPVAPHLILFGKKISYLAADEMEADPVHVEFLEWDFWNVLLHKDVPGYSLVTDLVECERQFGPAKYYPKLLAGKDPVCRVLDMRKGQVWMAAENAEHVGPVCTPRAVV